MAKSSYTAQPAVTAAGPRYFAGLFAGPLVMAVTRRLLQARTSRASCRAIANMNADASAISVWQSLSNSLRVMAAARTGVAARHVAE